MRIFFLTTFLALAFSSNVYAGNTGEVLIGDYLREATLDGLNGESKTLSEYKGKPLIINLWASYCGPCRTEMASLERLAQRYNGKDFNVIGISIDDYRNLAMAFIKQTGITFENYQDHKLVMEHMLGGKTIPFTILVDTQGRILNKVSGSREWDNPAIIAAIGQTFQIELKQ
jgi:thiol-disulfide isomerase/thioredoxin